MENKYFVIETQVRPDGLVNTSITGRSSFSATLSLYHERYSKMCVSTDYTKVALSLVDETLEVIEHDIIVPNQER